MEDMQSMCFFAPKPLFVFQATLILSNMHPFSVLASRFSIPSANRTSLSANLLLFRGLVDSVTWLSNVRPLFFQFSHVEKKQLTSEDANKMGYKVVALSSGDGKRDFAH